MRPGTLTATFRADVVEGRLPEVWDSTALFITRFLERWLGVSEPAIDAWRRTACGDLTPAFDFTRRARRRGRRRPAGHLENGRESVLATITRS